MHQVTITYIGGGSKDWAHTYFTDLLTQGNIGGELRLYDIDLPAARRNLQYFNKLIKDNAATVKSKWSCRVVAGLDESLKGADFVIISILPYKLKNMAVDVHYPERYGIWQPVGDTVGPGGYSRMLRTLPAYQQFARSIRENCPDAWVINYTNPMAMCINTLYQEFPEIKAFGCCHEVFGTQELLASIVEMFLQLSEKGKERFLQADLQAVKAELQALGKKFRLREFKGIDRRQIQATVQGINHFTWLSQARYKEIDLFPLYNAFIQLFRENNKKSRQTNTPSIVQLFRHKDSVKFELFTRFLRAAAAGDRHLVEFIPEDYLRSKKVWNMGYILTPVWGRQAYEQIRKARQFYNTLPFGKARFRKSGEEGVRQITALCGLEDMVTNVNLPNRGQLPNLPLGTAVETNAHFTKDSVRALDAGEMTEETAALVRRHAQNQKDFVEAWFARDKQALRAVFCRDPAVARLDKATGERLFEEMIQQNKECLEPFLLEG